MVILCKCIIYIQGISLLFASFSGQLWLDTDFESDLSTIGYIPTVSFEKKIQNDNLLDFEFSNKFIYNSKTEDSFTARYRTWMRYSNDNIDVRLGLQKISFGNSLILRPLNWFDSIDFRNITDQTEGLDAFRIQIFPELNQSIWLWCVDDVKTSCGGRFEFFNNYGSFGITYHDDNNKEAHEIFEIPQIIDNQPAILGPGKNSRIGFDYRYDGNMGLWFDGSLIMFDDIDDSSLKIATIGGDYTIPVYNGLLLMLETMNVAIESRDQLLLNLNTTAFMVSTPIGLLNDLMFVSILDWESKDKFNFVRWSTTLDYLSLSCMFSINPDPIDDNFKIMLIYNH